MIYMNCIIIHGCPDNAEKARDPVQRTHDKHWIPWVRKETEKLGISVDVPLMPFPWEADYHRWKNTFDKLDVNEKTILIGHSCGSAFLVRWLGETKRKVRKLILVAPWKIAYGIGEELERRKRFYEYNIDSSIRNRVKEITVFTSDNEEQEGKESAKIFNESLGGNIINLSNHGHYTLGDMKTNEFPELIEVIRK